ncbi:NAD(P)-dependent oxidoreductase [Pendulispora albinea]|uniref:NAD(P)H-binding protein n=1 Tax=Pendulispora albinea TaxID=2741071 RepID=A0ABZ2MAZ5_9BACT
MTLRLFVLGATGRTGTQIIDLALARGHEVTAFVRSPAKIMRRHAALTVTKGDPLDARALGEALTGHDAVVSALGPVSREAFRPSTLLAECAASTVSAMQRADVARLAIVSAALLFPERKLSFVFFRWFIRHHLRDLEAMETVVRATDFEWTIARPPKLVDSPDETYQSRSGTYADGRFTLSFRATAAFMIDCVERDTHKKEIVGLARPKRGAA